MAAFGLFTGSEALHHRAVSQSLAFRELRAYLTAAADGFAHVVLGDDGANKMIKFAMIAGYTSPARTTLGVAV